MQPDESFRTFLTLFQCRGTHSLSMFWPLWTEDVGAGGSGCGCSAAVLCSYIMQSMRAGKLKDVLFIATGALMSTVSVQQGESIPGICYAVTLSNKKGSNDVS